MRDQAEGPPDVHGPDESRKPYQPPEIVPLGTLEDLTRGPDGPGDDLNTLVISF